MTWNEAFRRYIARRFGDAAPKRAAESLKTTPSNVFNWCRSTVPHERWRKRIAMWSKGDVPAELHVVIPHAKAG